MCPLGCVSSSTALSIGLSHPTPDDETSELYDCRGIIERQVKSVEGRVPDRRRYSTTEGRYIVGRM